MQAGCYDLHLYCDHYDDKNVAFREEDAVDGKHLYGEFPHQYTGQTEGGCKKQARRDGWTFNVGPERQDICPRCSKAKKQGGRRKRT